MLEDAAGVLRRDVVTGQTGNYEFTDDVVVIQGRRTVEAEESGTVTVAMEDPGQALSEGIRFAVYQNGTWRLAFQALPIWATLKESFEAAAGAEGLSVPEMTARERGSPCLSMNWIRIRMG